ncbi:hypothetical protein [Dactylosporangium sp. NPDC005555]|uniref:hypothetical protein n=1 Tax=Dactylosporangium sp. NPDC005555 TaxID=3154889 RepID=UPI0033AC48D2
MEAAQAAGQDTVIESDLVDVASMPLEEVLHADGSALRHALERLAQQRRDPTLVVVASHGNALP